MSGSLDAQTHKLPGHGSVNQEDFPIAAIYIYLVAGWRVGGVVEGVCTEAWAHKDRPHSLMSL